MSNGHGALLSGREYDPGLMQKAQGRLTLGQKLWHLKTTDVVACIDADTIFTPPSQTAGLTRQSNTHKQSRRLRHHVYFAHADCSIVS